MKFSLDIYNIEKQLSINGHKLYPHQKLGTKWLIKHEKKYNGGLLADEMGLGKTIQIISMMIANPQIITLIVCPASLVNQWKSEINKFAPNINIIDTISIIDQTKYNVYVTSYNSLHRHPIISYIKFNRIVCDEAHYFRNSKSKTYNIINSIKSTYRWVLTGTPIQNYKSDIKTLFSFIGKKGLLEILIKKHMLRRTLNSVSIPLPKIYFDETIIKTHNQTLTSFIHYSDMHHLEKIIRLKQSCIIPDQAKTSIENKYKIDNHINTLDHLKLNTIIDEVLLNEHKTIIFSYFRLEIQYLFNKLKHSKNVGYIDGSISKEQKHLLVNSKLHDILIIQINAGGTGLNLQQYNYIYFTSPQWNPTLELQAIARAYRIGQLNTVYVKRFINANSIEIQIQTTQHYKLELIQQYIK